ncbi:hypothetical protein HY030_00355 [Candidatus Gottesmanbacteria bacterium]|nr:hypothetical protein [Candidatus Gottesmanbacteria bacterium]
MSTIEAGKPAGVFDFDGFLAHLNGEKFRDVHAAEFCKQTGFPRQRYDLLYSFADNLHKTLVTFAPNRFGWIYEGVVTASGRADVMVTQTAVTSLMLAILRIDPFFASKRLNLPSKENEDRFLQELYGKSYNPEFVELQEGLFDVLRELDGFLAIHIVTNSSDANVRKAIEKGDQRIFNLVTIRGDAKKYYVDPKWEGIKRVKMKIPGYGLDINLRRPKFYAKLEEILKENPKIVTAGGDIYPLDAAMFLELSQTDSRFQGITSFLMQTLYTPTAEAKFFKENNANGLFLITNLGQIPAILRERLNPS